MVYVGIDPGLDGAIAVIKEGQVIAIHDMPTRKLNASKREVDVTALDTLLWSFDSAAICVEDVNTHPSWSAGSSFTFGKAYGIVLSVVELRLCPYVRVKPSVWKKATLSGTDQSKEAAITRVQNLFPGVDLGAKPSHDRAEAVLLAVYARSLGLGPPQRHPSQT